MIKDGASQIFTVDNRPHIKNPIIEILSEKLEREQGVILISDPEPFMYSMIPRSTTTHISYNIKPCKQGRGTNHQRKKVRNKKKKR